MITYSERRRLTRAIQFDCKNCGTEINLAPDYDFVVCECGQLIKLRFE